MKNETYNGWTNYETWNYKLWMDNDSGSCDYYSELIQDLKSDNSNFSNADELAFSLADSLKDSCEEWLSEWMPEQSGPFSDILNCGVSAINWYEIAQSLIQDNEEAT